MVEEINSYGSTKLTTDQDSGSTVDLENITSTTEDILSDCDTSDPIITDDTDTRSSVIPVVVRRGRGRPPKNSYNQKVFFEERNMFASNQYFRANSIDSTKPFTSKDKIISFIEKDIFVMSRYEKSLFVSLSHAIEVLLPYHIYNTLGENIKYLGSTVIINPLNEIDNVISNFKDIISSLILNDHIEGVCAENYYNNSFKPSFTSNLLLFYEQRFFASKFNLLDLPTDQSNRNNNNNKLLNRSRRNNIKQNGILKEFEDGYSYDKKFYTLKKKNKTLKSPFLKKRNTKKGFIIKFKKSPNLYVYGKLHNMHLKYK